MMLSYQGDDARSEMLRFPAYHSSRWLELDILVSKCFPTEKPEGFVWLSQVATPTLGDGVERDLLVIGPTLKGVAPVV